MNSHSAPLPRWESFGWESFGLSKPIMLKPSLLPRRSVSKMRQPNTVSKWAYALTRGRVLQYAYCECYE